MSQFEKTSHYGITHSNIGGEIAYIPVNVKEGDDEQIKIGEALMQLVKETMFFSSGDKIEIKEID